MGNRSDVATQLETVNNMYELVDRMSAIDIIEMLNALNSDNPPCIDEEDRLNAISIYEGALRRKSKKEVQS